MPLRLTKANKVGLKIGIKEIGVNFDSNFLWSSQNSMTCQLDPQNASARTENIREQNLPFKKSLMLRVNY